MLRIQNILHSMKDPHTTTVATNITSSSTSINTMSATIVEYNLEWLEYADEHITLLLHLCQVLHLLAM